MSSLRERIDQEVYEAYQAGIDHNQVPFKYPAMGKSEIQEATGRIIAVFEAVLLNDEVVEAAVMGMGNCMREHGTVVYESNRMPQPRDLARAALQAALAAAMKGTKGIGLAEKEVEK